MNLTLKCITFSVSLGKTLQWFGLFFFSSFTQAIFDQYYAQIDIFLILQKKKVESKWN